MYISYITQVYPAGVMSNVKRQTCLPVYLP